MPAVKPDVYQEVTDRIIASLEDGIVPWQKPWKGSEQAPRNFNSRRPYNGINALLLGFFSPYSSPYWMTFNGAKKAGGNVRKGEKGTKVVLWRKIPVADTSAKDGKKFILIIRDFTVFNIEQTEGIEIPPTGDEQIEFDPIAIADEVIDGWSDAPTLIHRGGRAAYSPALDEVYMPKPEQFVSAEEYYKTLFHEFVHATGHSSRLGRYKGDVDEMIFGSESYSQEELIAEIGASFIMANLGIDTSFDNSANYIKGWLQKLRGDKRFIVQAASKASKAANYIQGIVEGEQAQESPEPAASV